jgi:uncharacterized protein YegP (UPF0339 family)
MPDKTEIYKDEKGEWRWRIIAANGVVVGASSEGYKNRSDCIENAERPKPKKISKEPPKKPSKKPIKKLSKK